MEHTALAESLFEAFTSGDDASARALCTNDLQAIQNHGRPMSLDTLLEFARAVRGVVENYRYEDAIRTNTANGFIEEHSVCGTLPDGSELRLAACVVGEVRNGKITALREYVDSFAAIGLSKALRR